ncbi:methyl-accepting chemotaxis protein [Chamaesiphon minutus]|uniref:Methyl-accepting chemotaxis protein n=1 Tax=Chamaesiphon minutus (strain ATCC 27169 / PCC 6605) TaxID=1173020 RepID=K9UMU9_CHAP6|nr:HAMP domain-containing methyl-accepting chemotaxis protein [Chamaesiphon minutus]AFY95524.1 methyl-accepting chemotaxis protein [Chamaesiphon minutus PCC 6605]
MISNPDRMQDYTQDYQLAEAAYLQGNYEKAATIIDTLVTKFQDDPSVRLLRGHIYCYGLYQYEIGKKEYEYVIGISTDPEFLQFAHSGLDYANSCIGQMGDRVEREQFNGGDSGGHYRNTTADSAELLTWRQPEDLTADEDFDLAALNFNVDMSGQLFPAQGTDIFSLETNTNIGSHKPQIATGFYNNEQETLTDAFAFGYNQEESKAEQLFDDLPLANASEAADDTGFFNISPAAQRAFETLDPDRSPSPFESSDRSTDVPAAVSPEPESNTDMPDSTVAASERPTMIFPAHAPEPSVQPLHDKIAEISGDFGPAEFSVEDISDALNEISGALPMAWPPTGQSSNPANWMDEISPADARGIERHDDIDNPQADGFDFNVAQAFQDAFQPQEVHTTPPAAHVPPAQSPPKFATIEQPQFAAEDGDFGPQSGFLDLPDDFLEQRVPSAMETPKSSAMFDDSSTFINGVSISGIKAQPTGAISSMYRDDNSHLTHIAPAQGIFAPFENASFQKKQWMISGAAGLGAAVVIAGVTFVASLTLPEKVAKDARPPLQNAGALMMLLGGLTSFGVTKILTGRYTRQVTRSVRDLQSNFEQVAQGNMGARATVSSQDELGVLSSSFNYMLQSVVTSNSEAQRKAREMELAKDELQRQVIRLLDDVEGAARGDLTVKAEVTADVLGAVADSFNLTIDSLRQIVQQVQVAAVQVNQSSTESEAFARRLSSDALSQAEELAVTVNSVQMMTASIKRVAESARESEEVARTASSTALRGGEAVERTVAGIQEIRETVAESTRKVKRLAESSQQISQIVSVISQIASRTNLLALNASIEAARAGESGKGFAIVADEVRQLADRSAKALKEIEHIVLQIQSETGSVMAAMEQGTQQVIQGTKLAEQAKRSLDDIIQVSNRIDALVRSITSDTIEQRETSKAVTEVMQSVEIQAQSTSQEAQKVSSSLENLVVVARNLLTYVERFKVE